MQMQKLLVAAAAVLLVGAGAAYADPMISGDYEVSISGTTLSVDSISGFSTATGTSLDQSGTFSGVDVPLSTTAFFTVNGIAADGTDVDTVTETFSNVMDTADGAFGGTDFVMEVITCVSTTGNGPGTCSFSPGTITLDATDGASLVFTISDTACNPDKPCSVAGELAISYTAGTQVTAVPEPGSLALFGTALAGLGLAGALRRRRRTL